MANTPRFASALLVISLIAAAARAQSTWTGGFSTDWNTAGNWNPSGVPNSATAVANFTGPALGAVNISSSVQVQSLNFNNPNGSFTLTSGGTAALTVAAITVAPGVTGVETINTAISSTGSLLIPMSGGASTLPITNSSTAAGNTLVIGPNTVIGGSVANVSYYASFAGPGNTVFSGSFATPSGTTFYGLETTGPGTLDYLGNGSSLNGGMQLEGGTLVLDYSASTATKLAGGQLQLRSGVLSVMPNSSNAISQGFAFGTFLANGQNDVQVVGTLGTATLATGIIDRDATATADFSPHTGTLSFTITTSTGTTNGLLGTGPAFATAGGGASWATVISGNIVALSSVAYGANVYAAGTNTDVTTSTTIASPITTNSLRFNTGAQTLTLTGTNTLQSGGILVTPSATGGTITGGTLTAPSSGELLIHQYSSTPFTIGSTLVSTAVLTKTGPGTLVLTAANPGLTGAIAVNRGGLTVTTTAAVNSASSIDFADNRTGAGLQSFTVDLGNNVNGAITRNIFFSAFSPPGSYGTILSTGGSTGSRVSLSGVLISASTDTGVTLTTPIRFTGDPSNTSGFNISTPGSALNGPISLQHGYLGINADGSLGNAGNVLFLEVGDAANGGLELIQPGAIAHQIVLNATTRVLSDFSTGNTITGTISGPAGLIKAGVGPLTLSGNNSYAGMTIVNSNVLVLGNSNALGGTSAGTTVASGATLDLGGQAIGAEPLTISGAGVGGNGALINSSATPASFAGVINGTVNGQSVTVGGAGDINLSGAINGNTLLTKIGSNTLTISGITDDFGLSVNVTAGKVVLAKTSSNSPDIHAIGGNPPLFGMVVSGGTAQLGGTGGDQIYDIGTSVTVTSGAFDANGRSESFGTLNLQGTGIANAGALVNTAVAASVITPTNGTNLTGNATIGVNQAGGSLTLAGGIGGNGVTITKVGLGTLTLPGSANPSIGTAVNAGTLVLAGVAANWGEATVNAGTLQMGAANVFSLQAPVVMNGGFFNLSGFDQSIGSLTGMAGAVQLGFATLTTGSDNSSTSFGGTVVGPGGLAKSGAGTLTLTNAGGSFTNLIINSGTVQTANDNTLGTGTITVGPLGTLSYTASTTTSRSIANAGTITVASGQTLTLNGATVGGGFLRGAGTFAVTGGTSLTGVTTFASTAISQTGAGTYTNFTNGGTLSIAANVSGINLNGFSNEGSGSMTMGAASKVNAADFQSYGLLALAPAASNAQATQLTNTGTTPLYFNGGSRTTIATPQTAGQFLAGVDLHGQNAVVAGGLFVNNGYVVDSAAGTAAVVADYGTLVKGAGFYQNGVITVNGGKFQAGNSPGRVTVGQMVIGPGGTQDFNWQINDAKGTAGPMPDANNQVDGWSLIQVNKVTVGTIITSGDLTWTATNTPGNQFNLSMQTLLFPTTVGNDVPGPMNGFHSGSSGPPTQFDGDASFAWPFISWEGTYTGPMDDATLTASTSFDLSNFVNTVPWFHPFSLHLDLANNAIEIVYFVPEPGTLLMTGLAAAGFAFWRRRKAGRRLG